MPNLIQAYDAAGLDFVDVAEARDDAAPALLRRVQEAHRRAADALAGEWASLSSGDAYGRASAWQEETERQLVAWGLHRDMARACGGGVAAGALRALGASRGDAETKH